MAKRVNTMTVLRTERLSPHFVRVYLGGEGFDDFAPAIGKSGKPDTDMYVKIIFTPDGVEYPEPFDPQELRKTLPPEQQPILRTYTVRSVDSERRELAIDFVVHGDEGIAGPWAASVQPGETVRSHGPVGGTKHRPTRPGICWPAMSPACPRWPRHSRRCRRKRWPRCSSRSPVPMMRSR